MEAPYHQKIICMPDGATYTKTVGLQRAGNLLLMTDWKGARGASVSRAVLRLTGRGQVSYMSLGGLAGCVVVGGVHQHRCAPLRAGARSHSPWRVRC